MMKAVKRIIKSMILAIPLIVGAFMIMGEERIVKISLDNPTQIQANANLLSQTYDPAKIPKEHSLTNLIADQIANELISKNPDGPVTNNEGVTTIQVNPGETLQKILESVKPTQQPPTDFDIPLSELSIIYTNDIESQKTYFTKLQRIIKETLGTHQGPGIIESFHKLITENDDSGLREIASRHEAAIIAIKKLEVPAGLISLHKSEIALLLKTKVMIEGLLAYSSDPMRAYLAFNIYPKLVEEAVSLQKEFNDYIKKEKIFI